ncbi:lipopolysaccharide biosynthesis protein [Bacteroides sp.]|uniref:lipopolysaccharide biosynthesis protein n=1 Tax=Bacteroides sp. TaxID=29523 RepID=UPI0023C456CD|nr:lipopolysaccharide biosynthesis protein [Bacteroides sp.]MDE6216404.1 lipopolysaccharide biosynthesis protein [Bacteroides sp.]
MPETSLKEKTAKGLLWGGFSNGMQQLLNLVFGIILARLLDVSDYGMVGMLTIFSAIAAALQEGGFISALTNRKEAAHKDYNAVFWFSFLCSVAIYILLFLAAPLIADFYDTPELIPLSRLVFLGFVISSLSIAPRAYLFKNLCIKETTIISLSSLTISGIAGITLAANGFTYWGIALQSITFITVMTALNFYFSRWRPRLQFDFTPIREMIGFSSKIIITNIFTIINNNLFTVLLGKFYSAREVGNFTQANKWNSMGHTTITGMINGIAQPVFTSVADDKTRQLAIFRKLLRFTAFISFPAMLGLSLVAKELIVITITEKWLSSAVLLQALCVWGAFIPVINLFSNLIISRGHSSIYMWSTISLSLLQLIAVCAMYPYGLEWMLRVFVIIHICWLFVWFHFVQKEIGLQLIDMLKDISPYLLLSAVLTAAAAYTTRPIENLYLSMAIKIVMVASLYALILWKLQSVIFRESIEFLLKKKKT